jgi:alpha,alpha-trehalose phosphorylase
LRFCLCWQGALLRVSVAADAATYAVATGGPVELSHHDQPTTVSVNHPVTLPIPRAAPLTPVPVQPPTRGPFRRHVVE